MIVLIAALLLWSQDPTELKPDVAVKEFKRAFKSSPKRPKALEKRQEALKLLEPHDGVIIAKTTVDAYRQIEAEIEALEIERQELVQELTDMVKGQETSDRTFKRAVKAAFDAKRKRSAILGDKITGFHKLQDEILAVIGNFKQIKSLTWLVENTTGSTKIPLGLQLAVVRLANANSEAMAPSLMKALTRSKKPAELAVILVGIAKLGPAAREVSSTVLKHLGHEDATVRTQVAGALATLAVPESIEPLIEQLAQEEPLIQKHMAAALEVITHQKLGTSVRSWQRWLAEDGQRFVAGEVPLGKGISALVYSLTDQDSRPESAYYYGIPQEGKSIVYVIDCSGSMVVSIKDPKWDDKTPVDAGKESRIEATKEALIRVLGEMQNGKKFNIIFFNDIPHLYQEKMVPAKASERKKAQTWVSQLSAASSTNIHDALQRAFRFAGRGPTDKHYRSGVDTIFLLTDGTPTTPDGKSDSTEKILEAVRRWNPFQRVTIHCIGIGKSINKSFLEQLARENGGSFVQH